LNCLIIFRSITYAQKAVKILERAGITAYIKRPPREITGISCSYAVKVPSYWCDKALALLRERHLDYVKVI